MAGPASKQLARRFDLPFIEGWLFVVASVVLTGIGIVVDVLGSRAPSARERLAAKAR